MTYYLRKDEAPTRYSVGVPGSNGEVLRKDGSTVVSQAVSDVPMTQQAMVQAAIQGIWIKGSGSPFDTLNVPHGGVFSMLSVPLVVDPPDNVTKLTNSLRVDAPHKEILVTVTASLNAAPPSLAYTLIPVHNDIPIPGERSYNIPDDNQVQVYYSFRFCTEPGDTVAIHFRNDHPNTVTVTRITFHCYILKGISFHLLE